MPQTLELAHIELNDLYMKYIHIAQENSTLSNQLDVKQDAISSYEALADEKTALLKNLSDLIDTNISAAKSDFCAEYISEQTLDYFVARTELFQKVLNGEA